MRDVYKKIRYKFTLTKVKDWLNKQTVYSSFSDKRDVLKSLKNLMIMKKCKLNSFDI